MIGLAYDLVAGLMAIMPEILWEMVTGCWHDYFGARLASRRGAPHADSAVDSGSTPDAST